MVASRRDLPLPRIDDRAAPRSAADDDGSPPASAAPSAGAPTAATDGVDASAFRHAFRQLAATVAVMTLIGRDGRPHGMTVTSMCGLSVDPPTLLVCVDRATRTHRDLMATDEFGIDVLADHQHATAAHCARSGSDKVLPARWLIEPVSADPPHLAGSIVRLRCRIESFHAASTHDIVVGSVQAIDVDADPEMPLMYHDGAFVRLDGVRIPLAVADQAARRDED
jgi:flavin reductase